jgi:hypothetical protein
MYSKLILALLIASSVYAQSSLQVSGSGSMTGKLFIASATGEPNTTEIALVDPPILGGGACAGDLYDGVYTLGLYGTLSSGCTNAVPAAVASNAATFAAAVACRTTAGVSGSCNSTHKIVIVGMGMSIAAETIQGWQTEACGSRPTGTNCTISGGSGNVIIEQQGQGSNDASVWASLGPGIQTNVPSNACRVPNNSCVSDGIPASGNEHDRICAALVTNGESCSQVGAIYYENTNSQSNPYMEGTRGAYLTAATCSSGTEVVTVGAALASVGNANSETITIQGASPSGWNITNALVTAKSPSAGTISFANTCPGTSWSSGGVALVGSGIAISTTTWSGGTMILNAGSTSVTQGQLATLVSVGDSVTVNGATGAGCNVINAPVATVNTSLNAVALTVAGSGTCTGGTAYAVNAAAWNTYLTPALPYSIPCQALSKTSIASNDFRVNCVQNLEWLFGYTVRGLPSYYPNASITYFTGRTYGGFCFSGCADGGGAFAYEQAFAIKLLLAAQLTEINTGVVDPIAGPLCPLAANGCASGYSSVAPLLMWADCQASGSGACADSTVHGAYGWAKGIVANQEGLYWCPGGAGNTGSCNVTTNDFFLSDGEHLTFNASQGGNVPPPNGETNIGSALWAWLQHSPYTTWYGD